MSIWWYILIGLVVARILLLLVKAYRNKVNHHQQNSFSKENVKVENSIDYGQIGVRLNPYVADHLHFDKDNFPFEPDPNQVIYIDSDNNAFYNEYIRTHYEEIKKSFREIGYTFCYLPLLAKELLDGEVVPYRFPYIGDSVCSCMEIDNSILLPYMKEQRCISPSFIHYDINPFEKKGDIEFTCFQLAPNEEVSMKDQIQWYCHNLYRSQIRLSRIDVEALSKRDLSKLPDDAREDFERIIEDYETKKLIDEVRERVEKLHQIGVNEMVPKKLFQPDDKLSRLVVTEDFRIMLPDYNEMEITMAPLPKAVFFLFLRHSEGILFKHLMDYRNELSDIYNKISNRTMKESIEKSISDITDPTNNSINEKCARIREAFITKFDERLACNYFVTGKRGEVKKILLPTDMVEWKIKL